MTPRPGVLALLPVRNGERVLPAWLESSGSWADAVMALDDGSTDRTGAILDDHPLVTRVITNPVRPTYAGWDDRANRQRLLDAAADLAPQWVMFLDADERIAPPDIGGVGWLADHGQAGRAYGFRIHAAADDLMAVDPGGRWVYRMFAWEPGLELPRKRLHLVPIPISIPRRMWLRTSVRILHVATTESEDLTARFDKYLEADPGRRWQASYDHLLDAPTALHRLEPTGAAIPVVLPVHDRPRDEPHPAVSAIVISRGDEPMLEDAVSSVARQRVPGGLEVIVVTSDSRTAPPRIRNGFPGVEVVELATPALPGAARNAGLAVARGDFVAFPSSHIVLPAGSLAARLAAHNDGWAMVTGSVLNGNPTRAGWASYFLDHSTLLPDRRSGEMTDAPTRCSYVRFMLDEVGGFPEDRRAGEDTVVNTELWRMGYSAYREQEAAAIHVSPCSSPATLAAHHYRRGRAWARILLERHGSRRRVLLRRGLLLSMYVPRRLARIGRSVRSHGRGLIRQYRRAYPLIVLGALAAFWGIVTGLVGGTSALLRSAPTKRREQRRRDRTPPSE